MEVSLGSQEQVHEDSIALTDWNQRQTVWQNVLLTHLSNAYNCQGVIKWGHDGTDGRIGFFAIGRPSDIATMRYQYAYFVLELTRLASLLAPSYLTRGSGKHWHKSFYLGAVRAISESLSSAKEEVKTQASATALAIFDRHAQEALALKTKLYPKNKLKHFHSDIDRNAWELGKQAGSGLSPKPGLGSGVRALLNR